jgi:L-aminopeptidase/D-esterase-like protein
MRRSGPNNRITDVPGILVGNISNNKILSGVTVVTAENGAVGGVDVRGSAPGTRETDLLNPVNLIEQVNAVALCGGSAFGLSAAGGVMQRLEEKGIGHPVGQGRVVPIVPAAVIFDLGRGEAVGHIGEEEGYLAAASASDGSFLQGNIGAGTGAASSGMKGGLGSASEVLANGITVGVITVVNSTGSTFDPDTGEFYARHLELNNEFGGIRREIAIGVPSYLRLQPEAGQHTTIGVVATDAQLTKSQATKLAQMAQDGIARAIYPSHTMFDGDVVFALATGKVPLPDEETRYGRSANRALSLLGACAADCFSRAIIHAIINAESTAGFQSYSGKFRTVT